jgi:hypothetical protein
VDLRKIFVLSLIFFVAAAAVAQNVQSTNLPRFDRKKYHFGFLLGVNTADFYVDRFPNTGFQDSLLSVNTNNQPGFNLGIVTSLNLTKNISIRFLPTLSFQDRALQYVFYVNADSTQAFEKRVESTFIEFPVNFKFRTDRINNFAVYALAGANFSIDMQSEKDVKNEVAEMLLVKTEKNNYSLEFGGGVDLFLPYFKFGIELKMAVGMPNLLVPDGTQFSDPIRSLRSRTFMLTFTFEG